MLGRQNKKQQLHDNIDTYMYWQQQLFFYVFRLFTEHPEVQAKYFPKMDMNDFMVLSKHGSKIMAAVNTLVNYVNDGNDEKLVKTINHVRTAHCQLFSISVSFQTCIYSDLFIVQGIK